MISTPIARLSHKQRAVNRAMELRFVQETADCGRGARWRTCSDCRAEAAEKKAEQLERAYPGISKSWRESPPWSAVGFGVVGVSDAVKITAENCVRWECVRTADIPRRRGERANRPKAVSHPRRGERPVGPSEPDIPLNAQTQVPSVIDWPTVDTLRPRWERKITALVSSLSLAR